MTGLDCKSKYKNEYLAFVACLYKLDKVLLSSISSTEFLCHFCYFKIRWDSVHL